MKFFKAMAYMTKKIFQVPEKNYGLNPIGSVHPGLSPPWPQSSGFYPPWPQSPWPQSPWPQSTWPQSPWNHTRQHYNMKLMSKFQKSPLNWACDCQSSVRGRRHVNCFRISSKAFAGTKSHTSTSLNAGGKTMQPMFNSCCADLLVNVSTEYPELVGYQGIYHPTKNETTGIGGKVKFFLCALVHICVSNFRKRLSVMEKE